MPELEAGKIIASRGELEENVRLHTTEQEVYSGADVPVSAVATVASPLVLCAFARGLLVAAFGLDTCGEVPSHSSRASAAVSFPLWWLPFFFSGLPSFVFSSSRSTEVPNACN